jgi:hypothetical protein
LRFSFSGTDLSTAQFDRDQRKQDRVSATIAKQADELNSAEFRRTLVIACSSDSDQNQAEVDFAELSCINAAMKNQDHIRSARLKAMRVVCRIA